MNRLFYFFVCTCKRLAPNVGCGIHARNALHSSFAIVNATILNQVYFLCFPSPFFLFFFLNISDDFFSFFSLHFILLVINIKTQAPNIVFGKKPPKKLKK